MTEIFSIQLEMSSHTKDKECIVFLRASVSRLTTCYSGYIACQMTSYVSISLVRISMIVSLGYYFILEYERI